MEQTEIDGATLRHEVTGSGEPVLLISTGPIADSFVPFVSEQALADDYCLIRYHQRRLDASAPDPAPVSFAEHVTDAIALLDHLDFRRVHVVGHSTGAAIALQMAVDHPEVVHSLTLLEPPLLSVPAAKAFLDQLAPALAAYAAGDREGAMVAFMTVVCSLDWEACRARIEKHAPGGTDQALRDADNFFGSYLPALTAWQFGPTQASGIAQPVLSVLGANSHPLFAESHELLQAWLPQLEELRVGGVAHLLHLENPEPVARGIAEFLARHPIAKSFTRSHAPSLSTSPSTRAASNSR
jgi:pimeloyl-ACP methyl ester carboxylesterase